jgi:hypothetical protein
VEGREGEKQRDGCQVSQLEALLRDSDQGEQEEEQKDVEEEAEGEQAHLHQSRPMIKAHRRIKGQQCVSLPPPTFFISPPPISLSLSLSLSSRRA